MKLFNGTKVANKILKELAANIKKEKLRLALAVILVGDNPSSKLYVSLKKIAAAKVGIDFFEFYFPSGAREDDIIVKIRELNADKKISGIIVQLPLPAVFDADKVIGTVVPQKDADGFHKNNIRALEKGEDYSAPVLPSAILLALKDAFQKGISARQILALVNSDFFGQTLKTVLEREGAKVEYIVRNVCIIKGAEKNVKFADVLISACGCPKFIKADMIKEGAVLIDAGITRYSDGRVVGDFDRENVAQKASYLTPVPGGIGPLTVALLLRNVYLAAKAKPRSMN